MDVPSESCVPYPVFPSATDLLLSLSRPFKCMQRGTFRTGMEWIRLVTVTDQSHEGGRTRDGWSSLGLSCIWLGQGDLIMSIVLWPNHARDGEPESDPKLTETAAERALNFKYSNVLYSFGRPWIRIEEDFYYSMAVGL